MATYLITQATGQQGLWTINYLLEAGAKVHALVRDPSKAPEALKRPGVTMFKGEGANFDDVYSAAKGCVGVYLNTYPAIPGLEVLQSRTIVDASRKAGIKTIVACTTVSTGRRELWDNDSAKKLNLHEYFTSKSVMEDIVRKGGFEAWTLLRPAFIHVNYMLPHALYNFPRLATHGELDHLFDDGIRMPQSDASDVGKYAAAALQDPVKFGGQEIAITGESLTIEEVGDILSRVSGRKVVARRINPEDGQYAQGQKFHLFMNLQGVRPAEPVVAAGKATQAKFGIPFTSLEEALQRDKSSLLECLPDEA
ncbi:hypothetical protein Trco_004713 [Trichoderma cornu-damae]|uniref:NmrA-like domain-containing protein n=1 Tax=Trichoderma cornu-damae TaxID=654480 RepID=A0A9P8QHT5_9HYPO|nr:hypothetical protein Trco_004713 [Trichoderma cornu-damae]